MLGITYRDEQTCAKQFEPRITPNICLFFAEVSPLEGSADPPVRGGWEAAGQTAGGAVDAGPVHDPLYP